MTVVLLDEAQRRFETEDAWWRTNRDVADLFTAEFESVVNRLARDPTRGSLYRTIRGTQVRRVLMRKTRCYVYWGARKQRGPSLDP